jgi:hypothetical protein
MIHPGVPPRVAEVNEVFPVGGQLHHEAESEMASLP